MPIYRHVYMPTYMPVYMYEICYVLFVLYTGDISLSPPGASLGL